MSSAILVTGSNRFDSDIFFIAGALLYVEMAKEWLLPREASFSKSVRSALKPLTTRDVIVPLHSPEVHKILISSPQFRGRGGWIKVRRTTAQHADLCRVKVYEALRTISLGIVRKGQRWKSIAPIIRACRLRLSIVDQVQHNKAFLGISLTTSLWL